MLGSTGESVLLTDVEKQEVLQSARKVIADGVDVIAGCNGESPEAVVESVRIAAQAGAGYALVITPSYFKNQMRPQGVVEHYRRIADNAPIPIIIYNVQKFTGFDLEISIILELAKHGNIAGIKESTSELAKLHELKSECPTGFALLTGNASLLWASQVLGMDGAILALSNFAAAECVEVCRLVENGQPDLSQRLFLKKVLPLGKSIVAKGGVPAIKAAMDCVGLFGGAPRLPLLRATEKARNEIQILLKHAELGSTTN